MNTSWDQLKVKQDDKALSSTSDMVLVAENESDLETLLNTIVKESEKMSLNLNKKKTVTIVVATQRISN